MAETKIDFEELSVPEALKQLDVDLKIGLSSAEAQRRFAQYGPNALEEGQCAGAVRPVFWGPMPWMIEAAAVVSILIKDWVDFAIILVLLPFNAVLGFWYERQAASALDALKRALAQEALALREWKWRTVLAKMLVPGDRVARGNRPCKSRAFPSPRHARNQASNLAKLVPFPAGRLWRPAWQLPKAG